LRSARRQSGCPEEAAGFARGSCSLPQLEELSSKMPKCEYREYLDNEVIAGAGGWPHPVLER